MSVSQIFREENRATPTDPQGQHQASFALGRYAVGESIRDYLVKRYDISLHSRVLDIGCGNGGILFPFTERGMMGVGVDLFPHEEFRRVVQRTGIHARQVINDAQQLPFDEESFDVVLYIDTIEHVHDSRRMGGEIARVLRPEGLCYVTTPARLRFLFRPDPHYLIRGLLLLPDPLQRKIFSWLRPEAMYEVTHTYWTVWGIKATLPGLDIVEVTSSMTAGPFRRLLWDWIVLRKRSS